MMPKNSLEKLLQQFPYFFDKTNVSNFYKSQSVTNEQFKEIYQKLFDISESFNIKKKCLIWKEQNEPYVGYINFVANYPNLKSVKLYKNDELIYTEHYISNEKITNFYYSYEFDTRNATTLEELTEFSELNQELNSNFEPWIIPQDSFKIEIETYDELKIQKGFPENESKQNDIYDHDYSLDEIGVLNNIPRKEYIPTEDYSNTEPPFNDRLTEDDYHYMNRILNYNILSTIVPLPVAEIWKLYGIEATMLNRERLLLKMFDVSKHETEKTELVSGWIPQPWEHKDGFCTKSKDLGKFFIVFADNTTPNKNTNVKFTFKILNSLAENIDGNYMVDIYQNDNLIKENYDFSQFIVLSSNLVDSVNNSFKFIAKENGVIIGEEIIEIKVRGCADADFHVAANGNDDGDGSLDNPFKTLSKAISKISSSRKDIAVHGEIILEDIIKINNSCNIIGCNQCVIKSNKNSRFFSISPNNILSLVDLTLSYENNDTMITSEIFTNNNLNSNLNIVLPEDYNYLIKITDDNSSKFDTNPNYHFEDNVLTGISLCGGTCNTLFTEKDNWTISFDLNSSYGNRFGVLLGEYNSLGLRIVKDIGDLVVEQVRYGESQQERFSEIQLTDGWTNWIIEMNNGILTVTIDGITVVSSFDFTGLPQKFGLRKWGSGSVQCKNFTIS